MSNKAQIKNLTGMVRDGPLNYLLFTQNYFRAKLLFFALP